MFVQLILTIGKARTFNKYIPPPFLCVFDYQKIAFLQYHEINEFFNVCYRVGDTLPCDTAVEVPAEVLATNPDRFR